MKKFFLAGIAVLVVVFVVFQLGLIKYKSFFINTKNEDLFPVEKLVEEDGLKYAIGGYINKNGELIIDFKYTAVSDFCEDVSVVQTKNEYGCIDKHDNMLFKLDKKNYSIYGNFSDGLAEISRIKEGGMVFEGNPEHVFGFVNKKGKIVIEPKYSSARSFSEGLTWVGKKIGKEICIDKSGNEVFTSQAESVYPFTDGLAKVCKLGEKESDNRYGFIDKTGKIVVPTKYKSVTQFSEGYSFVTLENKCYMIDKKGNIVLDMTSLGFILNFSGFSEGVARAETKNGEIGFIDHSGKWVIQPIPGVTAAFNFQEGLARVEQNGKWGFVNKKGEIVIPCTYVNAEDFENGLAKVEVGDIDGIRQVYDVKKLYIDKIGKVVYEPNFKTLNGYLVFDEQKRYLK